MDSAVNQAKTVIEKLSQASVRQVEEYCVRFQEKLITSAHDELLSRLQADLTHARSACKNSLRSH